MIWAAAALAGGVASTAWWGPPPFWLAAALALSALAAGVVRRNRPALSLALALAALALGMARGGHHQSAQTPLLYPPAGAQVRLEGVVVDEWVGARRTLQVERAALDDDELSPASGRVDFFMPRGLAPWRSRLAVTGTFEPSPRPLPGGLAQLDQAIVGRIDAPRVRILDPPARDDPSWLAQLRAHIDQRVRAVLPEPHGALLSAILVGIRSGIPGDLRDDFAASGLIHVVAISGFNITLVAIGVRRLAGVVIGRYGVMLAIVALPLYAVLAGADPGVVRAAVMGVMALLAWVLGRDEDALAGLSAAAAGIVLVDPSALIDVGFQLSFAATLGLLLITPGLADWLTQRARLPRLAAEILAATLSASLMVTPIIAATFERLQLAAVPANLLALAAPPWIMAAGVPVAVWAAAQWPLGDVVAWIAWVPLEYLIRITRLAAGLPGASTPIPGFGLGHAAVVYGAIALLVAMQGGRRPWRIPPVDLPIPRLALAAAGIAAVVLPPALAVGGAARLVDDGATRITISSARSAPTVYVRRAETSLVVAGDSLRPVVLDAALPAWDPAIDLLAMPRSDGRSAATALKLLAERPIRQVAALPLHALGAHLVAPDGSRRAAVDASDRAASGGVVVRLLSDASGTWTLLETPDAALLVAPPGAAALPPSGVAADVLVLSRRGLLAAGAPRALRAAGISLLVAPHPTRAQLAAVHVEADGALGARALVEGTLLTIHAREGQIEVRRPA